YLASGNDWAWVEPVQGVPQVSVNPEPWTALHKFALANGIGMPLYKGSGIVTGWLNNQFSMGEYNGNLRIGTTRGGWWGEGISNRLAILAEQDGALLEKGRIEGLAQGEKIYSMRFDRNRGYMVTFRQTDPLFTFDLSDPLNPRKVGELHVNGFATYIHLIGRDNTRLLTVGRSADATGRVTGNKLQLFDVSNLAAPALLGESELGEGWSAALYDYHAFLYYEPLGILAIPYYSYGSTPGVYSSGLRVFTISEGGISLRGMIPARAVSSGYGSYADTVDRSVIIGTDIYAIAHRTVTVAGTAQLDIRKVIPLPEGYAY
ncbi:MAG: beta-propeller domain-containing protein, partial [Pelobacteraceae bacterium]